MSSPSSLPSFRNVEKNSFCITRIIHSRNNLIKLQVYKRIVPTFLSHMQEINFYLYHLVVAAVIITYRFFPPSCNVDLSIPCYSLLVAKPIWQHLCLVKCRILLFLTNVYADLPITGRSSHCWKASIPPNVSCTKPTQTFFDVMWCILMRKVPLEGAALWLDNDGKYITAIRITRGLELKR